MMLQYGAEDRTVRERQSQYDSPGAMRVYGALAALVPAPRRGHRLLQRALSSTKGSALPSEREEMLSFVRGPVRDTLEDELGDRLARRISAEMERTVDRELSTSSPRERRDTQPATPSSRRLQAVVGALTPASVTAIVALVHDDRVRSTMLARGLLRAGFKVNVGPTLEERLDPFPTAVIVSESIALDLPFALRRFLLIHSDAALVVCDCRDAEHTERVLRAIGVRKLGLVCSGAPSTELLCAAQALTHEQGTGEPL